jgi:putative acetyltransferase
MFHCIAYQPRYAGEVAALYHLSVHNIDPEIYSLREQEAWAPTPPDLSFWQQRLESTSPWLMMESEQLIGFVEYRAERHYIDCLYVHPLYQRQGIAGTLLKKIEASLVPSTQLHTHASKVARPFFEQHGFVCQQMNKVQRRGVTLVNYSMVKEVNAVVQA